MAENSSDLDLKIEKLLIKEKDARQKEDVEGTRIAVLDILQLCYVANDWKKLNEHILLLSKRRGQLNQVVTAMVQQCMDYVAQTPNLETKVELMKTLNNVCAGKIFLELERARLVKGLARIMESQGFIRDAAELMQQIVVETFGRMAKTEKIAFILEQIRLCLDLQDYARAQILSRKISPRVFVVEGDDNMVEEPPADIPSLLELKRIYYELMIRYHSHNNNYLQISCCYKAIYDIPSVREDPAKWIPVLRNVCWNLVLAPHDPTQSSLLTSTLEDKNLSEIPYFRVLLKKMVTREVINWTNLWDTCLSQIENEKTMLGVSLGHKVVHDFKQRIIEHNILVVSKYYSRITMERFTSLLCITNQETEKILLDMVVSNSLVAKVDRPTGTIRFQTSKDSNEVLNSWAFNLEKLLHLVDKTCHLIHKETMIRKAALTS